MNLAAPWIKMVRNGRQRGEVVEVQLSLPGGGRTEELESLDVWLRGEPEFLGRVKMSAPAPQAGEMGALT
jgi:hypothetical protein